MPTDMSGEPGALRRLMNKVARWSDRLDYPGIDYTFDRIASVERQLAEVKKRVHQLETSRHEARDPPSMRGADQRARERPADPQSLVSNPAGARPR